MKKLNFSDYKNLDETLLQKEKSNRKISESISFIFFMSIFLAGISSLIIDISPKCSRLEYSNNCVSNLIHIDQKYSFLFAKKTSNYIHLSDAKQLYQAISLNRIYYKYSLTSGQKKNLTKRSSLDRKPSEINFYHKRSSIRKNGVCQRYKCQYSSSRILSFRSVTKKRYSKNCKELCYTHRQPKCF